MEWWTTIMLLCSMALLYYPQWEDDRRRRRQDEHDRQSKRLDLMIKHGVDVEDPDLMPALDEWMHWHFQGRPKPHV